mgnify:CR=1 FL=1
MKRIIFSNALLPSGWAHNVALEIDDQGIIAKVSLDDIDENLIVDGYALPGMNNIHSHAFQRAMAGLAEYATSEQDSFWTWRDIMYRFADKITAADLEVIATQLYLEMLKAGFVSVAEFHYLHHNEDGNLDMSHAIMNAALETGIGLCHLPVLYNSSGFGGLPLEEKQKRFGHDADGYINLLDDLLPIIQKNKDQNLGMALHSLRAVPENVLKECLDRNPTPGPIHIHISEQMQEVKDCIAWSGKRPVEWLYDNIDVDKRWCLIHATHLNDKEVKMIARSGAVVGLCPATEANLGDGLFPLRAYLDNGGQMAIGSDSHISISIVEELRLLEYGQRLKYQKRNIATSKQEMHSGTNLYLNALKGGAQASGFDNGVIEVGKRADIIVLDPASPLLAGTPVRHIIDRFIFNGNVNAVKNVFVGGSEVVSDYKHAREKQITGEFIETMERLKKVLD